MAVSDTFKPATSDAAVVAKTGKTWDAWFAVLDGAGAAELTHQQIVKHLATVHELDGWWQQMITNSYEQRIGRRGKHQKADGYQIGVSKTLDVPIERAFAAWTEESLRATWLSEPRLVVRRATPPKSMRITWPDGTTVSAMFYAKGADRSQVTVNHEKLPTPEAGEAMKTFWRDALDALQRALS
jgi:hypothetical protein